MTEVLLPPQPLQPSQLKIDELLKRQAPQTDLYEETRNWTWRGNADQWVRATLDFGNDWLPKEVTLLADKIDRDSRTEDITKYKGVVTVP